MVCPSHLSKSTVSDSSGTSFSPSKGAEEGSYFFTEDQVKTAAKASAAAMSALGLLVTLFAAAVFQPLAMIGGGLATVSAAIVYGVARQYQTLSDKQTFLEKQVDDLKAINESFERINTDLRNAKNSFQSSLQHFEKWTSEVLSSVSKRVREQSHLEQQTVDNIERKMESIHANMETFEERLQNCNQKVADTQNLLDVGELRRKLEEKEEELAQVKEALQQKETENRTLTRTVNQLKQRFSASTSLY